MTNFGDNSASKLLTTSELRLGCTHTDRSTQHTEEPPTPGHPLVLWTSTVDKLRVYLLEYRSQERTKKAETC